MRTRSLLFKTLLLACLSLKSGLIHGQEAAKPSFDCAKAKTPYETEICSTPELAKLDVDIAKAYAEAQIRLKGDDGALAALKASQRELIAMDVVFPLLMHRQLAFLKTLDAKPRTSLQGVWTRPGGTAAFTIADDGNLAIGVSTVDGTPPNFQICEWDGSSVKTGTDTVRSEAEDGWGLDITRKGRVLVIKAVMIDALEAKSSRRHCTFGSVPEGTFIAATKGVDD